MARALGTKNFDHRETRAALVAKAAAHLLGDGGASLRELARGCDASPSTLRHYFGSREGLLEAVLLHFAREGQPCLVAAVTQVPHDVEESLRAFLENLLTGWSMGVDRIHAFALKAGLGDRIMGPLYVQHILEPTLQALEARLARHVAEGTLAPCDLRVAALALLGPVLLSLLHQDALGGAVCRPLDRRAFVRAHLTLFLTSLPAPTAHAHRAS